MKKYSLFFLLLLGCQSFQSEPNPRLYMEASTLWIQSAAEVDALCYQAYNAAQLSLEKQLRQRKNSSKKPAVVLDADETVLDNSPYQATGVLEGRSYSPKTWGEWVKLAKAPAIPGAVEFLKYADREGVEIFLITNRSIEHLDVTYKNLKALGIPIKRSNLLLKTTTSNKVERRQKVFKNYDVLVFAGDVLADFPGGFEHQKPMERAALAKKYRKLFGTHYIVLPNPMYGEWESSLYNYKRDKSDAAKSKLRRSYFKPIAD